MVNSSKSLAMVVPFMLMLMAVAVSAEPLPVKNHQDQNNKLYLSHMSDIYSDDSSSCFYPFEPVGDDSCYYFSTELRNYEGAIKYCEGLTQTHTKVTLAMLEYGEREDQELLIAAASKQKTYWVGGKAEDGVSWKWLDNRDIYMGAPFWYHTEPNEAEKNCMALKPTPSGNNYERSYGFDYSCDEPLHFICQTGCPFEFELIGSSCYLWSVEEGIPNASWQESREICQSFEVPEGHHTDLAVLGMDSQESYYLMNRLVEVYTDPNVRVQTWIGGYYTGINCDYTWVDGRSLPDSSTFWYYSGPTCESDTRTTLAFDPTPNYNNGTWLYTYPDSTVYPFICQMFRD